MYPSLTSLVTPPDPFAGGSAPVSQVISQELLSDFKDISSGNEPLSEAIQRQIEDRDVENHLLEAQEGHAEAQQNAQEPRIETDGLGLIPSSQAVDQSTTSSSSRMGASTGSSDQHGPRPMGTGVSAEVSRPMGEQSASATMKTTTTASMPAPSQALRHVPAAVLRAIEVESSLQVGTKNLNESSTSSRSGGGLRVSQGSQNMGPTELRTLHGMTSLMAQRGGRLRIQLEPLQLGPVTIDVEVHRNRVSATIETSTPAAQRVLEAATSRLRSSLESQGYTLDRLDVRPENSSGQTALESESSEEESNRSRETRDDGRSRHERHSSRQEQTVDESISFTDARIEIASQEQDS